jgi:uncharacterized protein DUF5615
MIKYLVDEHLSPEIAIQGRDKGLDIEHVNEIGLDDTEDAEIWEYCLEHHICMVSIDIGFRTRAEDAIQQETEIPGFFAVGRHLKEKKAIGRILEILVLYHESIQENAADYDTDIKNQIVWIS